MATHFNISIIPILKKQCVIIARCMIGTLYDNLGSLCMHLKYYELSLINIDTFLSSTLS